MSGGRGHNPLATRRCARVEGDRGPALRKANAAMWEKSASCTLELDARHALLSRPLHQHLQQDKIRDSADCDGDVATAGFGNGETRGCTPRPSPQQQKDPRTPSTHGHWACQTLVTAHQPSSRPQFACSRRYVRAAQVPSRIRRSTRDHASALDGSGA